MLPFVSGDRKSPAISVDRPIANVGNHLAIHLSRTRAVPPGAREKQTVVLVTRACGRSVGMAITDRGVEYEEA